MLLQLINQLSDRCLYLYLADLFRLQTLNVFYGLGGSSANHAICLAFLFVCQIAWFQWRKYRFVRNIDLTLS